VNTNNAVNLVMDFQKAVATHTMIAMMDGIESPEAKAAMENFKEKRELIQIEMQVAV
jgi:hypothetical protein